MKQQENVYDIFQEIVNKDLTEEELSDLWYFWSGSIVIGKSDELNINVGVPEVVVENGKRRISNKTTIKFPAANTCTFTLNLPCYSEKELFLEKLKEAIKCWEFKDESE